MIGAAVTHSANDFRVILLVAVDTLVSTAHSYGIHSYGTHSYGTQSYCTHSYGIV